MKNRPTIIKLLTASLFVVPVVAVAMVYVGTRQNHMVVNANILVLFWLLCIGSCVVGYGVWKVRSWGFFLLLALGAGVVVADLQQIISNPSTLNFWDFVDGVAVTVGISLIARKHVREPYFNPKIRWWETPTRHKADLLGQFKINQLNVTGTILDISSSGCFVGMDVEAAEGDVFDVAINHNEIAFTTQARMIRRSLSPKGMGLMFIETDKVNKKNIKQLLRSLTTAQAVSA